MQHRTIPLTQGLQALIDAEDYDLVSRHSWCLLDLRAQRRGLIYAQSRVNKKLVYMHHFILPLKKGFVTDHINGNGLDNRRCNLRQVSDGDNKKNRRHLDPRSITGVNGVSWDKTRDRYKVDLTVNGITKFIGRYITLDEAVTARKAAELKFWGKIFHKDLS